MSNFDFLESNKLFRSFAKASIEAEKGLETNPVTCIMLSRKALELGVKWLYANDKLLLMPYQTTLSALTHKPKSAGVLCSDCILLTSRFNSEAASEI